MPKNPISKDCVAGMQTELEAFKDRLDGDKTINNEVKHAVLKSIKNLKFDLMVLEEKYLG